MNNGLLKLILFLAVTCCFVGISWRSLRRVRSHGFFRFFAWEAILGLVLISSGAWFSDAFSARQIVSWVFLLVSLIMLGQGMYLICVAGKPDNHRRDSTLLSFEKTSTLVTSGIYHHVRHPLYGSLLFLAWGAFLKEISWYAACLVAVATWLLILTAKADEVECVRYFGPAYEEYMKKTKMFVPYLFSATVAFLLTSGTMIGQPSVTPALLGSCAKLFALSEGKGLGRHSEIVLHVGTGHGILYKPLDEWILPTVQWAK